MDGWMDEWTDGWTDGHRCWTGRQVRLRQVDDGSTVMRIKTYTARSKPMTGDDRQQQRSKTVPDPTPNQGGRGGCARSVDVKMGTEASPPRLVSLKAKPCYSTGVAVGLLEGGLRLAQRDFALRNTGGNSTPK